MGTNYYVRTPPCANACEHCSQVQKIHLGKSSVGWAFVFRGYPETQLGSGRSYVGPVVQDFEGWLELLRLGSIEDEYGDEILESELLELIMNKQDEQKDLDHTFCDETGHSFMDVEFC